MWLTPACALVVSARHVEIIPLSTGCLGACTYCKTKHARGHLGSYALEALVERVRTAAADPLVRPGGGGGQGRGGDAGDEGRGSESDACMG